jgi:uncharacterized protein with NRDE domain
VTGVCTVIVGFECMTDASLIVAANRDELRARPSDPPMLLTEEPPRWGGRDRVAGGTWLAVDPGGRVGAVTNRHPGGVLPPRDPARRSRGGLPLEVLTDDDASAAARMSGLQASAYNPVNVLYLSPTSALWTGLDDASGRRTRALDPGVHVITEQDPDDPADPKGRRIRDQAEVALAASTGTADLVERWRQVLRSHESPGGGSPACIHADLHGTVSSATVLVGPHGVRYEHADGPPCITPYVRVL